MLKLNRFELRPNLEIPGLAGAARDDDDELLDLAPLPLPLVVCLVTCVCYRLLDCLCDA